MSLNQFGNEKKNLSFSGLEGFHGSFVVATGREIKLTGIAPAGNIAGVLVSETILMHRIIG